MTFWATAWRKICPTGASIVPHVGKHLARFFVQMTWWQGILEMAYSLTRNLLSFHVFIFRPVEHRLMMMDTILSQI